MSLQGPIVIVADNPAGDLVQILTGVGAFPVIEVHWSEAPAALESINPAAVLFAEPDEANLTYAQALAQRISQCEPYVATLVRVRGEQRPLLSGAVLVDADAPAERLLARLNAALRLRGLHATVLGRARSLRDERNIVAELPAGDPLDDATVLVVGRGPAHPTLTVAVGERMGVMGALSVETAASCLGAREIDGVVIGDGLPLGSAEALLELLAQDARFRELAVGMLGGDGIEPALSNFVRARDPLLLVERLAPLVRLRAFEGALKRLLRSIECKGMLDPRTGLLNEHAFGTELERAIADADDRGVALSLARFSLPESIHPRVSYDAARLVARLVRDMDFACRQDDGSILFVFTQTDLRAAHVAARRLASVLKHTMLRSGRDRPPIIPDVTLATLKPTDSLHTLLARVTPRPVAVA